MRKSILFVLILAVSISLFATNYLIVHKTDNMTSFFDRSTIDSVRFTSSQTVLSIYQSSSTTNFNLSDIDSLTFRSSSDSIKIVYSGTSVTITNPYADKGVTITTSGADVTVNSTITDEALAYYVSGTASDGSLKIYSDYKYVLDLNGVSITNSDGPAINIQSGKKCTLNLEDGTTSLLTDGASYTSSSEDQKGTLFSEGQIVFTGGGTLNVAGKCKHGICSDDYISIEGPTINITSAKKDGLHCNDYFEMTSGTLSVTATSDGIECEGGYVNITGGTITTVNASSDVSGIIADSIITISGGIVTQTVSGDQSKGIKSDQQITLSGGTITINTSGAAALSASGFGYDPSYCTGIKSDSTITLSGANITITSTGSEGKGISSDKDVNMTAGTVKITTLGAGASYTNTLGVTDSYTSFGISADGNICLLGGTLSVATSGTASKGISADGNLTIGSSSTSPVIYVKNTGTKLLVSGTANYTTADYSEPKNLKSDGILIIAGGTIGLNATQQGANTIDSDSLLYITGGIVNDTISGNQSKGIKSDQQITLSGGTINVKASGDVVLEYVTSSTYDPSYCAAIKSDATVTLSGSSVTIVHSGAGGKGFSAGENIEMSAGTVNVTTTGAGTTYKNSSSATDSYNATCLTADENIVVTGGSLITSSSGTGGKGLKADGTITIGSSSGSPTTNITTTGTRFTVTSSDYCHPKAILATGAISVVNGTNTINSTDDGIHSDASVMISGGTNAITASSSNTSYGEGVESPYIYITGGTNTITASNDGLNATKGSTAGGTEQNDGSLLSISGGTTYVTGADAIDSNGNFTMSGGIVFANGPSTGVEESIDINGGITVNGGILVGCGSSQMKSTINAASSQPILAATSRSTISSNTMTTLTIAGTGVISFKPKNGGTYILFSCPSMTKNSAYKIYTGGSYSGGIATNNLYLDGTFSSSTASQKASGTLSGSLTVNTVSF